MRGQIRLGRLAAALALSTALAGWAVAPALADSNSTTPIKHVVVLFQENISFDHYFGTYPNAANIPHELYSAPFHASPDTPQVNGYTPELLDSNTNKNNSLSAFVNPVRLAPYQAYTCSNSHSYLPEQEAEDMGLMDRFPTFTAAAGGEGCLTDGSTVMAYFDGNTVTELWNYAQHFAMSDNSFGSTFGPSSTGVINLVSGQTLGGILHHAGSATGNVFINTNSVTSGTGITETVTNVTDIGDEDAYLDDCGKDVGGTVVAATLEMTSKNIGDLLNAKNVTWGWFQGGFAPTTPYNPSTGAPAVCGSQHIEHSFPAPNGLTNQIGSPIGGVVQSEEADYVSHHAGFMFYASTRNPHHLPPTGKIGTTDQANHNYDTSVFFASLKNGQLPAVSFIKAPQYQNAHPGSSDPIAEKAWLVQVINAIMASPDWPSTAIIIAYDDSDGWYDHVSSPIVSQSNTNEDALAAKGSCGTALTATAEARCGHGFRQPLLVISPYSKHDYVDHSLTNQASIIAFIEQNWTLGTIDGSSTPAPGTASFDRTAGSLDGMFDFQAPPDFRPLILNQDGTVQAFAGIPGFGPF